jgi:hypothetical protein
MTKGILILENEVLKNKFTPSLAKIVGIIRYQVPDIDMSSLAEYVESQKPQKRNHSEPTMKQLIVRSEAFSREVRSKYTPKYHQQNGQYKR